MVTECPGTVVGDDGCGVHAGEAVAVLYWRVQPVFGRGVRLRVKTMPYCIRGDDGTVHGRHDPVEGVVTSARLLTEFPAMGTRGWC